MPRGPTVTAIGMWVADAARDHCKECHKNFGFFTRRHHCRRCGDIFCSKDSDFWSRDIPELPEYREREALRVCRSCFMHHLCHMVVHRGRFGLKYELFGSNYEAQAYFDKLKSGRLLMHVRSGNLLQCSADSERIRESLVNRAQGARNMLLGGHDIAPLLQPEGDRQSRLSFIVDSPGRVPIGTHHMVFCAQLIATGAWSHTVIECATGPQRADMIARFEEQFKLSNQLKRAVVYPARDYSTPLSVKGSGVLNLTLASTIVAESRKHLNSVPYLVIYHIAGKCQSMKCANLIDGFTQLEKMPNDCPCMLIAPSFDIVAKRRCDLPSFEEAMLTFAGEQLLAALNIPQVAVISNYAAPSITTNMYTARYAAKAILASSGPVYVAIIGIPTSQSGTNSPLSASSTQGSRSPRPSPLQTTSLTPDTLAVMLWNSFNQDPTGWFVQPSVVMSLVQITKATELLRDALRRAAEPRDVSPRADGPMTVPDARALVCECCICMDMYDVQNRRPVVCPECGNTICLTCWRQTPKCPSCRSNRSANPTFCIPLIQLLPEP